MVIKAVTHALYTLKQHTQRAQHRRVHFRPHR